MKKNRSIAANLEGAKSAIHAMVRHWHKWKEARDSETKAEAIAAYAAAFTSCKVFVENYLKQLYPNEHQMPMKVGQEVRNLVSKMDVIEKANDKKLNAAIHDIEQLGQHAA